MDINRHLRPTIGTPVSRPPEQPPRRCRVSGWMVGYATGRGRRQGSLGVRRLGGERDFPRCLRANPLVQNQGACGGVGGYARADINLEPQ